MLMPNKTKFRKQHKGRIHGVARVAVNWLSVLLD